MPRMEPSARQNEGSTPDLGSGASTREKGAKRAQPGAQLARAGEGLKTVLKPEIEGLTGSCGRARGRAGGVRKSAQKRLLQHPRARGSARGRTFWQVEKSDFFGFLGKRP